MKSRYLLILFLLLSVHSFAIDGKIKVFIKSKETVYTSQKVTAAVELLSDAFSISDVRISFPSSGNFIVEAPKSASYLGQTEVDGTDWQMVHYEYEVYALRAGQIEIPSFSVFFTASMGYGQPKKEFELQSQALAFNVKAPEGIENNQFVLVTDNYTLHTEIKPEKKELIVGDAVELTVTQKAYDVPDILLRPVRYQSNALLRVYEKEPELQSELKGKFDVSRIDRFTFVASAEGNVTLPAQETVWWNTVSKKVQREKIPEIQFEILPDPQIALDAKKAAQKKSLMTGLGLIILVALLYWLLSDHIKYYLHQRKMAYDESEKGKYEKLLKYVDEGDMAKIYRAFYVWIKTIHPETEINTFKDIYGLYPEFKEDFYCFENSLLSYNDLDKIRCRSTLGSLRKRLLKKVCEDMYTIEKELNP